MKKDLQTPDFDSGDLDILSILEELQASAGGVSTIEAPQDGAQKTDNQTAEPSDTALPTSPTAEDIDPMVFLSMLQTEESLPTDSEKAEAAPLPAQKTSRFKKRKKAAFKAEKPAAPAVDKAAAAPDSPTDPDMPADEQPSSRIRSALRQILPQKGDAVSEAVRKCVFLVSLLAFLVSSAFLLYYMALEPQAVKNDTERYQKLYADTATNEEEKSGYNYPAGMLSSFRQLYDINPDIAGWLSYVSTDSTSFLNIQQPVVHCDNNETYLSHAFDRSRSRSGTLFFDKRNTFTKDASNRVSIIYGHNMASGLMFAKLNKLIGNMYYARCASQINLRTLYDDRQYKVFAVLICDEGAKDEQYFSYLRTAFADDGDFLNYVQELRARSLFDYPVDVNAQDELLILSTCTAKSQAKVSNGRLAVVARRVRADESAEINTVEITENADVIMPYAWYTAQNLTPHVFYTQADYHIPADSQSTTTGTSGSTTAETTGSGTTTGTTGNGTTTAPAGRTAAPQAGNTTKATTAVTTAPTTAPTSATAAATTTAATTAVPTTTADNHSTTTTEGAST